MRQRCKGGAAAAALTFFLLTGNVGSATQLQPSVFDRGLQEIKQQYSLSALDAGGYGQQANSLGAGSAFDKSAAVGRKSPTKAFVLSLVVPGLGQYYYGSRTKPFLFLGTEIAAWALHIKWHNDGEDRTDEFEAYADAYWKEQRYTSYLQTAYKVDDDEELPTGTGGMTHHLPDTPTQQYYEMIGKYDQFSWGWVDAYADGDTSHTLEAGYADRYITEEVPHSAHRNSYVTIRQKANDAFDRANRMIVVSMANRIISAFEAYFITKIMNRREKDQSTTFGRVKMKAELKSYSDLYDTPFLNVSYRF